MLKAFLFAILSLAPLAGAAATNTDPFTGYPEEAAQYFEDAKIRYDRGELQAAVIQLKNALDVAPGYVPARILLGRTRLRLGDGAGAEKELRLAQQYGADEALITIPLANAYFLQGKYQNILDGVRDIDPGAGNAAELWTVRGQALFKLNRLDAANEAFAYAMQLGRGLAEPLLGRARIALRMGKASAAEDLADRAAALQPGNPETWYLKAELRRLRRDLDSALELYDRVLELNPRHIPARNERAATLIELDRHELAFADVQFVLDLAPRDPKALYLLALLHGNDGDLKSARAALEKAARSIQDVDGEFLLDDPPGLLLSGVIHYALREFETAAAHLSRYINFRPYHAPARKLYGAILIQNGSANEAIDMLLPAHRLSPRDPDILTLLGDAYLQLEDHTRAMGVLEKAAALAPRDPDIQARLAVSQLALGSGEKALAELENGIPAGARDARATTLLALVQLRKGNLNQALELARTAQARQPGNPIFLNLEGVALLAAKEPEKAREKFTDALRRDPGFAPALHNLADMDLRAGRYAEAKAHLDTLLGLDSKDVQAMFGLSSIAEQRGDLDTAIGWLEKIRAVDRDAVSAQLHLVELYIRRGSMEVALRTIQELAQRHDSDFSVLALLGQVYALSGQRDRAISVFEKMSRYAGHDARELLKISVLQSRTGDTAGAYWSVQKAVRGDPDFIPAQVALVGMEIEQGNLDSALESAARLRSRHPDLGAGDRLLGDIMMRSSRFEEAVRHYSEALAKEPSADLSVRLYRARRHSDGIDAALGTLRAWLRHHPDDAIVRRALAGGYIDAGRFDDALSLHTELLRDWPDDPLLLNNAAWLRFKLGRPDALRFAQEASRIAPDQPELLDTLGWILVQQGEPGKGLSYLRDAHARASGNPQIRYHLAAALANLGRFQESLQELESVLDSDKPFEERSRARALYQRLTQGG